MSAKFIAAIKSKNKIRLHFFSKQDNGVLVRTCAPMDRLHVWDYDSDTKRHTLSLLPNQIVEIEVLEEKFEPTDFITWNTTDSPWFVARDWGVYS